MMETKETSEFIFTPTEEEHQLWVLSRVSGETYRIDLKDFVCACSDYRFRHAKGDRLCKHLKAASEAYGIELPQRYLPAMAEGQAITVSQEEIIEELSTELRDEMVNNYVYAVPDYNRQYIDKQGRKRTTKKPGWIDLKATGVRDLAHMVADRYGRIEVGEFKFMDVGDRWVAWRDIKLGNFTSTGFADCPKDREFPFRYLGEVVMRNAYKAIVPKIYQDIFTNKFRELMRSQLAELLGPQAEAKLEKPIADLTDGELARELKEAQEAKLRLKQTEEDIKTLWPEEEKPGKPPPEVTEQPTGTLPKEPIFRTWGELASAAEKLGVMPSEIFKRAGVKGWSQFRDYRDAWTYVEEIVSERRQKPKMF